MESEAPATRYASSPAGMLLNFLQLALVGSILLRLALPFIRESADFQSRQVWFFVLWLACIVYVVLRRRARVEITDDEVVTHTPRQGTMLFPRDKFSFTHRARTHTFKNIPLWTDRFLIADNGATILEASLPNFSRRSFSLLMASLRPADTRDANSVAVPADLQIAFAIPKERMVGEYRRFMLLYFGGSVAAMIAYSAMMYSMTTKGKLEAAVMSAVAIGFLEIFFGAFIVAAYRRKRRDIPERIAIDGANLLIGDAVYPLADIRTLFMTPPQAGVAAFANARLMRVETDFETASHNLGPRGANGMMKTMFDDYGLLCKTLERIAELFGFQFVNEL